MNTKNRMEIMQNSYIIKKPYLESKPSVSELKIIWGKYFKMFSVNISNLNAISKRALI